MATENEFLLQSLFMGVFITFIYDILRIFRRVIPHKKFAVSIEDIIFWIYCAAKVFLMMHHESNGTMRWFAVLGALTGMVLYIKLFSPFFVKGVSFVLTQIISFLLKPFMVVGRWAKKKLTFLLKMLKMSLYNK